MAPSLPHHDTTTTTTNIDTHTHHPPPAIKLSEADLVETLSASQLKSSGLTDDDNGIIPSKFILPVEHRPAFALTRCSDEIPVVDMAGLDASDPMTRQRTLATIHKACLEWGFFQVRSYDRMINQSIYLSIYLSIYPSIYRCMSLW